MTMPNKLLHPQSLLMETTWVCQWFQRLIDSVAVTGGRTTTEGGGAPASSPPPCPVVIADRSPFSAMFYARRGGALLEPSIRTFVEEVAEAAGVHVVTVHVRTERPLLWGRIQDRLAREPHRMALNEGSAEWMDQVRAFYDGGIEWDAVVENNEDPLPVVARHVLQKVAALSPTARAAVVRAKELLRGPLADLELPPVAAAHSLPLPKLPGDDLAKGGAGEDDGEGGEDEEEEVTAGPPLATPRRGVVGGGDAFSSLSGAGAGAAEPGSASSGAASSARASGGGAGVGLDALRSPIPTLRLEEGDVTAPVPVPVPSSSSSSSLAPAPASSPVPAPCLLLSLDGNIGAGKTTLLQALRIACPDLVVVKEPVDEWMQMCGEDGRSILELFYADPQRYAYLFQHTTLLTRIANTRAAMADAAPGSVVVSERSILTDRYVFATMLRAQGTLSRLEMDLYKRWWALLADATPVQGVLYLDTSPDTCAERITRRNRPGEKIDPAYLVDLDAAHKAWLSGEEAGEGVDGEEAPAPAIKSLHISFRDGQTAESLVPQIRAFVGELQRR
jgi:deoxyadenosine/deoxycytidine kinase